MTFEGLVVLQPGDHDPGCLIHLSWLLNPSKSSMSRTTAWPVSRLNRSVHLPTTPSLRLTVACMVCSSLFVNAEISKELPAEPPELDSEVASADELRRDADPPGQLARMPLPVAERQGVHQETLLRGEREQGGGVEAATQ